MTDASKKPCLLITGARGGFAKLIIERIEDNYELVGVDPRPLSKTERFPGRFYQLQYNHRKMAEIFRQHRFDAVLHLGRVRVTAQTTDSFRYNINVLGTRNLLNLCRQHQVPKIIVISSYVVYGAHWLNHVHIREDEPLRASQIFPELVDAVELDHAASHFMWRYPDIDTILLRPANVIGPKIHNAISSFFRNGLCPKLIGFDPLLQFIHESDFADALELCLTQKKRGIFNIAGEGAVPYSRAIRLSGAKAIPVPPILAQSVAKALLLAQYTFPKHLIDYFRYPTIISDVAFRAEFDYFPRHTTVESLSSLNPHLMQDYS